MALHTRWAKGEHRRGRLVRAVHRGLRAVGEDGVRPRWVTLEVRGRRTGRATSSPLVVAPLDGERYLVALRGEDTGWVRNVRAAGGRAVLRHGRREPVRLEEVPPAARPPVIRRYLELVPGRRGARPAPEADAPRVAADVPVFRVVGEPVTPIRGRRGGSR
ncbi:nitroreductase/quinone reductase family protein [Geodermatophilus sp. SYSU D00708]